MCAGCEVTYKVTSTCGDPFKAVTSYWLDAAEGGLRSISRFHLNVR
jgi:hypothetical protein